ncbi:hypothetical protein UlMin_039885 [Ulmus minor]
MQRILGRISFSDQPRVGFVTESKGKSKRELRELRRLQSSINYGSAFWLERPFEEEEIKKAVFEIDREKSPGPDGYTGAFFQDCWGILKNDMKLDVQQVKDFRPISLVSGVYKILAKVLANRLREVLEETISMTQGAFVHNRQILDVVLVATEAVEDYRKRKKRGVIFKVDFEKAYDHVNWDFLDLVFGASRGLRQGDPLSPFLFILVADILGRMMDKAVSIGEVKGFKVGREEINIQKVHTILNFFSMCSGSWPMKYLGLPLGGNPNSTEFWNPVVEKVGKRLDGWKKAVLSKGGRLTMIQSVLSSIPIYFMSLFKLPNGVAVLLEKMMRQFLWDREVGGKGKSLVDWKLICTPKECGGLGIGNLLIRNKALLGKWLWRFPLEQHTLWAAVIRSKYGLNREG